MDISRESMTVNEERAQIIENTFPPPLIHLSVALPLDFLLYSLVFLCVSMVHICIPMLFLRLSYVFL